MSVQSRTVFVGDNLPVLRGMEAESVDMIYADPPFNSNRNYAAPIGSKAAGAMFRYLPYRQSLKRRDWWRAPGCNRI